MKILNFLIWERGEDVGESRDLRAGEWRLVWQIKGLELCDVGERS